MFGCPPKYLRMVGNDKPVAYPITIYDTQKPQLTSLWFTVHLDNSGTEVEALAAMPLS